MAEKQKTVLLNFLPLTPQDFSFTVYRKPYQQGDKKGEFPGCIRSKLPASADPSIPEQAYSEYWASFVPLAGYDGFECSSFTNQVLTVTYLYRCLKIACKLHLSDREYLLSNDFYKKRVAFTLVEYPEGCETVWLEPYYLRSQHKLGFLVDFHFRLSQNTRFSRRVQQLSLSLDKTYRSNRDFYIDRFEKVQVFLRNFYHRLFPLSDEPVTLDVEKKFLEMDVSLLDVKRYIVADNHTTNSQFNGIREYGPLAQALASTRIWFIFRAEDRAYAQDLFRALRGDSFETFLGMERMFKFKLNSGNVSGYPIDGFNPEQLEKLVTELSASELTDPILPIVIFPYSKGNDENGSREYYLAKHTFLRHRIPTQFIQLDRLKQKEQMRWAIANIGLQAFAKMGGVPWIVKPQVNKCLIIGLGQAHEVVNGETKKYFAYSILTESTGIYKDLQVLGRSTAQSSYMNELKKNLLGVFSQYLNQYDDFVVHASFGIHRFELEAVQEVLDTVHHDSAQHKRFVVMKFNDDNKYFGYAASNNSLVPFESTCLALSRDEFLIWFEGLQYNNPRISKRIGQPVHIQFIYPQDLSDEQKRVYLQDAINLSGANWRGFNAKNLPVSIYYAQLVARYFREFQSLGLSEVDLNTIHPWFL
ncbi:MAG: hypothetical protein M1434_00625 [Chloroflexi bacterium]|nr:hypothetical protein [Chloroflexota bacterium]MCL5273237.1 hypothetical protein [Chloroflexota bacterium]